MGNNLVTIVHPWFQGPNVKFSYMYIRYGNCRAVYLIWQGFGKVSFHTRSCVWQSHTRAISWECTVQSLHYKEQRVLLHPQCLALIPISIAYKKCPCHYLDLISWNMHDDSWMENVDRPTFCMYSGKECSICVFSFHHRTEVRSIFKIKGMHMKTLNRIWKQAHLYSFTQEWLYNK